MTFHVNQYNYDLVNDRNFNPFKYGQYKYPKEVFTGFIEYTALSEKTKKMPCCYIIHHPASDKIYIGSTKDLRERAYRHTIELKRERHNNEELQTVFNQDNYIRFYIQPFLTVEDARNKEDELLKAFQNEEFVVNETASAWNQKGYKHTEESKAKMRETRNRPEMIEASRQRMLGKPNTEEQKRKISQSLKGRPCPEHVKKINSEKFKGVLRTDNVKKNIKAGILEKIDPVYCDGKVYESVAEAARQLGIGHSTVLYRISSEFKTEWYRITKDDPRWLAHLAEQEGKQTD